MAGSFNDLTVDFDDLRKQLQTYSTEVMDDLDKEFNRIASRSVRTLKETAPYREPDSDSSGKGRHYRDSWKKTEDKNTSRYIDGRRITVLSRSKPHLTHLLENGHRVVLPQGYKPRKIDAKQEVAGIEHIRPVQEEAAREVDIAIDKVLRRHGKL